MNNLDLKPIPVGTVLRKGGHASFEKGACIMELVSHLSGEPHSDRPECACAIVTAFAIGINDQMPDDATRTRHLLPLAPLIAGSRADLETEIGRGFIATDWAIRTITPMAFRLAAAKLRDAQLEDHAVELIEHAEKLQALPEVNPADRAARSAAVSAESAAWSAVGSAAETAETAESAETAETAELVWAGAVGVIERMLEVKKAPEASGEDGR